MEQLLALFSLGLGHGVLKFPRLWSRLSGTGSPALPYWPEGERHLGWLAWLRPRGKQCGGLRHAVATTRKVKCWNVYLLQ